MNRLISGCGWVVLDLEREVLVLDFRGPRALGAAACEEEQPLIAAVQEEKLMMPLNKLGPLTPP